MVQKKWKIWVDTGGTFTDALAFSPEGYLKRVKLLSSSSLRGRLLARVGDKTYRIQANWPIEKDILAGYTFNYLGRENAERIIVLHVDHKRQTLELSKALDLEEDFPVEFEVTAGEEAPVMAARMITQCGLQEPLPPLEMRLGSTKGTNALLERKGAKVGLLVTKGFQDVLEIGNQQRPDLFSLSVEKAPLLYSYVVEVEERIGADGTVLQDLQESTLFETFEALKSSGCEVIAIALMHSYVNPLHEQKLKRMLVRSGWKYVSASYELAPNIKIVPRAQTAVVNAYLSTVMEKYLSEVSENIPQGSLKVMTSAGGLVAAGMYHPKDSLLSGPAGGVVGARDVTRRMGYNRVLTLDMGGTSTDVSKIDEDFDYRYELKVGDATLLSPALAIETVAAGGGSICSFDGFKLNVGPESAGAFPGPACYGAGGPLTVTDVNLLLGRLIPDNFGIPVHREQARQKLKNVVRQVSVQAGKPLVGEEILSGFLAIANEKMAEAVREISVRKGHDPRDFALLGFGGAGGQHACAIAGLLHMDTVLIPYDAGLLSAYGIGKAIVERFAIRQVLAPLRVMIGQLDGILQQLQMEAYTQLKSEGYSEKHMRVRFVYLYLRFAGQEHCVEIKYQKRSAILYSFREAYQKLYGHWLENREIEVESVKLVASVLENDPVAPPEKELRDVEGPIVPGEYQQAYFNGTWYSTPVYPWEKLVPKKEIQGPAIVTTSTSTLVVEPGWALEITTQGDALIRKIKSEVPASEMSSGIEAVNLELFTHRFKAIAEEMGAVLERTAFSVNVKERMDFSCALLDRNGELVVNAPHIPVHLGSLGVCVRKVKALFPMNEGDVVITNHPGFGGSHLPDITLISPVYFQQQLIGYVANRAHHAELGGKRPGSMPPDAQNLAEEGVVISPRYLVKKNSIHWKAIRQMLEEGPYPSRSSDENLADLSGGLASLNAGVQALQRLCEKHSKHQVKMYMKRLKAHAAEWVAEAIHPFLNQSFEAIEYLDDGTPLQVKLQFEKNNILSIDFSGTGPVHPGNFNATPAIVNSVVIYFLRLLVQKPVPLNEGLLKRVKIIIPEGLLNPGFSDNPEECPAVVGGNTETSQRLVDTLIKALGIAASSQGTMNNLAFGNASYGYYETIAGGTGAGRGVHGANAVHHHMTNTRITDPEVLEKRYPVRLEEFSIRQDSGGKGQFRGGKGLIRKIRFLETSELTILAQHRVQKPFGIHGGEEARPGRQWVVRKGGAVQSLNGVDQCMMYPGDVIVMETPGGGGYGKPDI
ncbi:hydantoinase B/oxoprolinase family protein [Rapidithrix thailandica]|uniref:Hydantoinase B/oxoprolinase family protein n=1 Tax=Rapidithrix thailandica TaxID=413964 RepID=A0AAW9SG79_9BACT